MPSGLTVRQMPHKIMILTDTNKKKKDINRFDSFSTIHIINVLLQYLY